MKNKAIRILAHSLSVLLHPMLMPCYGIALYFLSQQPIISLLPKVYSTISIVGTLVLTLVIPLVLLLFLWRKGYIDSLHIDKAQQRTMPYIYTLVCYGFWTYFLHSTIHMPKCIVWIAVGAIAALLAVAIINRWWKISAHLTGIGGLLGGICSFSLCCATLPIGLIITVLLLSLLLMYARLYLQAHTPMQVVCGYLLGLVCTFLPNLIMTYA